MKNSYRVAVWGPGVLGQCAIRELIRLPETELVGAFGYSESKNGVDAGTLSGVDPVNVAVTTDLNEFIALNPDCVLHTARDFGDFRADEDIINLLENGINVITVLPYQYSQARGEDVYNRLNAAAIKGGVTLHGNGLDPGFMYERLAALMTGLSNDIEYIRLEEYVNAHTMSPDILELFGFGNTLEQIEENPISAKMAANYLTMGMKYLADHLGTPVTRIEQSSHHLLAENKESIGTGFAVEPGTVGMVSYQWKGYTKDDKPMFQIQLFWYLNDNMKPDASIPADDYWVLAVEGVPSTRVGIEIKGSVKNDEAISSINPGPSSYLATIVPAIQAIPVVMNADPGIYDFKMPDIHWKPDLRN